MSNALHSGRPPRRVPSENCDWTAPTQKNAAASPQPRFRLLVVDDAPEIRELTSEMLAEEGYEIMTAEDGVHALELLSQFHPDLVVTDLKMPRMSGFELLKILRERFPRLPVIVVSGEISRNGLPPSVVADAFLPKGGCYIKELGAKINELLSGGSRSLPSAITGA